MQMRRAVSNAPRSVYVTELLLLLVFDIDEFGIDDVVFLLCTGFSTVSLRPRTRRRAGRPTRALRFIHRLRQFMAGGGELIGGRCDGFETAFGHRLLEVLDSRFDLPRV